MTFLNDLKKESVKQETTNGAIGYSTTLDSNLDLYSNYTSFYGTSNEIQEKVLRLILTEDKTLGTKNIFHGRSVRTGAGDRSVGRKGFSYLLNNGYIEEDKIPLFIDLIAKYGSYKDVVLVLAECDNMRDAKLICEHLNQQLRNDDLASNPSLLAKYMPTETTSNKLMKLAFRKFILYTGISHKEYRKRNTRLRSKINIVETKLTNKDYESIDYSKVPSQAMFKYMDAFIRNDNNYLEYINNVKKGTQKMNTATLQPYQIVERLMNTVDDETVNYLNTTWEKLEKPDTKGINVLPVIDVSGSMYNGGAIQVALSLGMTLSESLEGEFKNHFITFSDKPKIEQLKGETFDIRLRNLAHEDWGYNTDLEKVFQLVLNTAIKNDISQEEFPKVITILSDMQFDEATDQNNDTFYETMRRNFEECGYELPFIVFWNINANRYALPVVESTKNTMLISGFSSNLFNYLFNLDFDKLQEYTPKSIMLDTLNSKQYDIIEKLYE